MLYITTAYSALVLWAVFSVLLCVPLIFLRVYLTWLLARVRVGRK